MHEFNNILGIILGRAELGKMKDNSELRNKCFEAILISGAKAKKLIENLSQFSTSKANQTGLQAISIEHLIEEVVSLIDHDFERANIAIEIDAKKAPDVFINPTKIQQVFLNMFINAKHAMPNGGKVVIRIWDDKTKGMQMISIKDTGSGIAPENLERIFQPYFSTKIKEGKGSGLGLSISMDIVREYKGDILVKSELGKGSEFTVVLPSHTEAEIVVEKQIKEENINLKSDISEADFKVFTEKVSRKFSVLIVDDEKDIRDIFEFIFENKNFEIFYAGDGLSAIEICSKRSFDIIFLDIMMPKMKGTELYFKLKSIMGKKPNVIFISGFNLSDDLKQIMDNENLPFIAKPFHFEAIWALVKKIIYYSNKE